MKWVVDEKIKKVDKVFLGLFKYLNLIRHVTPINVSEEKIKFFSGENLNPVFEYKEARTDISEVRDVLEKLEIPHTDLGKIYERVRFDFLKRCDVIDAVGVDDSVVMNVTSEIYGWPNEGMVEYAKKILRDVPHISISFDVSSAEMSDSFREMIDYIGLSDWIVKYSKKWLTRTKHSKKILVCEKREFSKLDLLRLPVHEVGVHAVRYENGYLQPLKIFGYGFPDFLRTEEGLATYFEEVTGNSSDQIFRNYAGRVIAIDCLHRGLSFRECFMEMKTYGFDDDGAWTLSVRAYRGGGFVKDHVYLEGYLMVKKFLQEGGDVRKLYVGKVGLDDVSLVNDLLLHGIIQEPAILPDFLFLSPELQQ